MKAISDGLRRELEAIATARGIDLRIADAVSHGCAVPATARYSTLQDLDDLERSKPHEVHICL